MSKALLLIFVLFSCSEPNSTTRLEKPQITPQTISFEYVNNFTKDNKYFKDIINLREDCFKIRSSAGLVGGKLFIGVLESNTVGYFAYFRKSRATAFIHDVCIASPYRGKGVGRQLFNRGLSQIEAIPWVETLELDVDPNNPPAIRLYKSAGFEVVKTYTKNNDELFLMRKNLIKH